MTIDNTTVEFIRLHENDEPHSLALQTKRYPAIDMPFVINQIAGRQIARNKLPLWYVNEQILYPPRLAMEQCSSEPTACYKASLLQTNSLADLTGGFGVDTYFMSRASGECFYVEQQPKLAELAAHNFEVLGAKNIQVFNDDALLFLRKMQPVDTIYIDPARRDTHGRKTVLIEDCMPNLIEIEDLLEEKSKRVIIKLSPMLDISLALKTLRNITEVHIVSCHNECKELLFIKDSNAQRHSNPIIYCINLQENNTQRYSFTYEEEMLALPHYASLVSIGNYLYEPNVSILKAGAYKSLATRYNLSKLHPSSHLYISDYLSDNFQGRIFSICNTLEFNKKNIKLLSGTIDKANIAVRNFPLSVAEIRKKTGIKDGGDRYIFATTLFDEQKVLIICLKES
jgi:hypothetical protein